MSFIVRCNFMFSSVNSYAQSSFGSCLVRKYGWRDKFCFRVILHGSFNNWAKYSTSYIHHLYTPIHLCRVIISLFYISRFSIILSLSSLLVFLMPVESGEKVSLSITIMLSYSVLLLVISDVTPRSGSGQPYLGNIFLFHWKCKIISHW